MKINDLKIKKINDSNDKVYFNVEKNYNKVKELISISITVNNIDDAIEFLEISKKIV